MATCRYISVSAALIALALAGSASADEALTVEGRVVTGELSGQGQTVSFNSPGGALSLDDLAQVCIQDSPRAVPLVRGVVTRAGDCLRGAVSAGHGASFAVASARLGRVEIPISQISQILFDSRAPLPGDVGVLFRNGDFTTANSITLSGSVLKLKSSLGDVEVPLERVAAVRIAAAAEPAAVPPAEIRSAEVRSAELRLDNGDLISGALIAAGGSLKIAASFGEASVDKKFVCSVDFPARRRYLSDLHPALTTRGFAPSGVEYLFLDAGPSGELRSATRNYLKGIFARAGAAATITLPPGARALVFTPEMSEGASPARGRFSVECDGVEVWKASIDSSTAPRQIILDVRGKKSVALVFETHPQGLIGAAAIWADALVTVPPEGKG